MYRRRGLREDRWRVLRAWKDLLPGEAVFAGAAAAWLAGLDLQPDNPVEVIAPPLSGIRSRKGLIVHRLEIADEDVVIARALRATTLDRTLSDLCTWWPAVEALVALDMAVAAGKTDAAALGLRASAKHGRPGSRRLRELAELAAPAESPMETRLRWVLIQAGVPPPSVQADLHDAEGRFIGRADMLYPSARLVVEYDGENHRDRLVEDNRRQNLLVDAGFQLLRFTASDVHRRPDTVAAQVQSALARRVLNAWASA